MLTRSAWVRVRARLGASLWLAPAGAALLAIALAKALVAIDGEIASDRTAWFLFVGQPDSARELLSTIASSLLSFTAVVFSITILVLQLASSQFSPRVLPTFLADPGTRVAMGVFIGSFVYAMVLLPEIRDELQGQAAFVPALSVFVAFVLVLASVGVFVRHIHHMAHSIRVIHIIGRVGRETRRAFDTLAPAGDEAASERDGDRPARPLGEGRPVVVVANGEAAGVIASVDEEGLLAFTEERDLAVELVRAVGDFVPRGAPLFRVSGPQPPPAAELLSYVVVAEERTSQQDPSFGFRQLVDIADRALSPGINDPTTATQVLHQLHDLLRAIATRRLPSGERLDRAGRLRLVLRRPGWDDYVRLAFEEIREYGGGSLQTVRTLRATITDLLTVAPPHRQPVLHEQLRLLEAKG